MELDNREFFDGLTLEQCSGTYDLSYISTPPWQFELKPKKEELSQREEFFKNQQKVFEEMWGN